MAQNALRRNVEVVLIGGSAGSLEIILAALPSLRPDLRQAIIIILHRKSSYDSALENLMSSRTTLPVKEAEEKEKILPGTIYLAPAGYHLLIERDKTFSMDFSEKIHFSRPAIDATFQTAAEVYGPSLAAIVLSGANSDGAEGLEAIQNARGITAVQNPLSAEVNYMPEKALAKIKADYILENDGLAAFINSL